MSDLAPTTFAIPTLETERLFLRAPRAGDVDEEIAFWTSERSRILGGPLTADQAWRGWASIAGHWMLRGYGFWALEDKASGRYMGRVGLWYPEGHPDREIGWTLMAHAEGRGYAFEAARAARGYAYESLGWGTAISLIAPDNIRSQALARRLGAAKDGTFTHRSFGVMDIWRHPGPGEAAA